MKTAKKLLALVLAMLVAMGSLVCASAVEDLSESEENNEFATADVFGIGTDIKAKLSDISDKDYFAFTAAESGLVTVTLKHDKKNAVDELATYFEAIVYDSGKNEIDSFKSKGDDAEKSISFSVTPGAYYVLVEKGSVVDTNLEYVLTASISKTALFEKEPNNISSFATPMTASKKGDPKNYYGAITSDDGLDVDYYKVDINSETLVMFGIYNTASKSGNYKASFIQLVDGQYGQPLEKEIGSVIINEGESSKDSPNFGVDKGVYYLKVQGVGNSTGGYQVRVYDFNSNGSVGLEHEYNNDAKYAQKIEIGKTITGELFDEKDIDVFYIDVPANNNGYEIILADFDGKKDVVNGQWFLEVSDKNGHIIEEKMTITNAESTVAETEALQKGSYYFEVSAGNVFTGETYKITIKEKKADPNKEPDPEKPSITTFTDLFKQLMNIDWSNFIKNFEGWFEFINIGGMLTDLLSSVAKFFTEFIMGSK